MCRDCGQVFEAPAPAPRPRCPVCRSPGTLAHRELFDLAIAHVDADAFYASVEKRDDPALRDRPVIVGGGRRGVVAAACYIARAQGVRSAMPMFKALKSCPDAVVVRPRMAVYAETSRLIRGLMEALTPLVEPLSLDEAFMDLSGTARLHGAPPAVLLARLAREVRAQAGVSVSVGLSHNKFLAKIASDLDKPQGFALIGRAETAEFLADQPVGLLWGVGRAAQARLEAEGIRRLSDLRAADPARLVARHGADALRLHRLAHGLDDRPVSPRAPIKSLSNETTFDQDLGAAALDGPLWRLAEKLSARAKAAGLAGRTVTLKLKRADFRLLTRSVTPSQPVILADSLYRAAAPLLAKTGAEGPFRLLGLGLGGLVPAAEAEGPGDLLDPGALRRGAAERAADVIRARFGAGVIGKGRGLR